MTSVAERKAWDSAVSDAAKARGWKRVGSGYLYQVRGSYIFRLEASAPHPGYESTGTVSAKPLCLDPVFWRIVGLDELNAKSVGFRISGAFTVPLLDVYALRYGPEVDPAVLAERLDNGFSEFAPQLETIEDFEPLVEAHSPPRSGSSLATYVSWLIAMRRDADAVALIDECLAQPDFGGGFSFPGGMFETLALGYLTS